MLKSWHLVLFTTLAGYGFYYKLLYRAGTSPRMNSSRVMPYISDLQRCSWEQDQKEYNGLKLSLVRCCNAWRTLLVTQENAPIGHFLNYETQPQKTILITPKIHQMLPKVSPFRGKALHTCAVVGNGGILQNRSCGHEIDSADCVFRFNLPPMNRSHDIGKKCDLVTANPSILKNKFESLSKKRKPFIELVKSYGSALVLMPAFSYTCNTNLSFKVLHTMEDFGFRNRVVFFHPDYLANLALYWKNKGLNANRLSSGFMVVSAALELCEKVTLYGFWPFSKDPEGKRITHHYYDDILPSPGFHAMNQEFYFYVQMHVQGNLLLKVGQC
ncbi:alpha-2,8-sialyltransferase 8F-like [Pelodytes ibericus]